jgi:hypothetical protein
MVQGASAAFVNHTSIEDTYISEITVLKDTNFGSDEIMKARSTSGGTNYTYIKFNVTDFSSAATLNIYVEGRYLNTFVHPISNDWNEDTTTWNSNRPSTDIDLDGVNVYATPNPDSWWQIDISQFIGRPGVYSFGFRTSNGGEFEGRTSEYPDSNYYPYIQTTSKTALDTIYVNASHPNASNNNNGTADYPYLTFDAAINDINYDGTIYVIGEATCNDTAIGASLNGVVIDGLGSGNVTFSSDDALLKLTNTNGLEIKNITLKNTYSSGISNLIVFDSGTGSDIHIHNSTLYNERGSIFKFSSLSNATDLLIENNNISSGNFDSTHCSATYGNAYLNNVTFSQNDIDVYSIGLYFDNGAGTYINVVNNNITSGGSGVATQLGYTDDSLNLFNNLNVSYNDIYAGGSGAGSGVYLRTGNNNTVSNNIIWRSDYTGIKFQNQSHTDVYNNIVYANGYSHNAVETKGIWMNFWNNSVFGHAGDSDSHIWYGAGTQLESYNLIENSYSNNTDVVNNRLIMVGAGQNHTIFRNITADNHKGTGIFINGQNEAELFPYVTTNYSVFDNITVNYTSSERCILVANMGSSYSATNVTDYVNYTRDSIDIIDTVFNNATSSYIALFDEFSPNDNLMGDVYITNPNFETSYWDVRNPEYCDAVVHWMYYLNAKVVDGSGNPIDNAVLTFEANITNPETGEILKPHNVDYGGVEKAYTDELESVTTNSLGYVPTRDEDAANTVALTGSMTYNDNSSDSARFTQSVEWNVTATYDGVSTSQIITVSSADYSPDPSDLQGTLYTFTLVPFTSTYVENVTITPDIDSAIISWDALLNAVSYKLDVLQPTLNKINDTDAPTIDGLIDDIYLTNAQEGIIRSPNPVDINVYESLYGLHDNDSFYFISDAHDNDVDATDDMIKIAFDITGNGLTTDDRQFIVTEYGETFGFEWTGSAWTINSSITYDCAVTGAGTSDIIFELEIPKSELNIVEGTYTVLAIERSHSDGGVIVQSYYPDQTAFSFYNPNGWATVFIAEEVGVAPFNSYTTTNTTYTLTDLDEYSLYNVIITAFNGLVYSEPVLTNFTTSSYELYTIDGYIFDSVTLSPLNNSYVSAIDSYTTDYAVTDENGYYLLDSLRSDDYTLYVSSTGYTNTSYPITVASANQSNVNISMVAAPTLDTIFEYWDRGEWLEGDSDWYIYHPNLYFWCNLHPNFGQTYLQPTLKITNNGSTAGTPYMWVDGEIPSTVRIWMDNDNIKNADTIQLGWGEANKTAVNTELAAGENVTLWNWVSVYGYEGSIDFDIIAEVQ